MNKTTLVLGGIAIFAFSNLRSYTSAPPAQRGAGYSGGIAESGRTCGSNGGCHNTSVTQQDMITIPQELIDNGYTLGEEYVVKVTGTSAGINKFGFQLSVQDESGNFVGTLEPSDNRTALSSTEPNYIGHLAASTPGTGSNTWEFVWKAPTSGSQKAVTFFGVVNATNGNGSSSGDVVLQDAVTTAGGTVGIAALEKNSYNMIQNGNQVRIDADEVLQIDVFNLSGQLVQSAQSNTDIFLERNGVYLVQISKDSKTSVEKIRI